MESPVVQPLPQEEVLLSLADLYRVFGDGTRLKILCALLEKEKCVCDLAAEIGASVSAVSHQLRILKQAKLVRFHRQGKTMQYALADDHVRTIIGQGMEHISE